MEIALPAELLDDIQAASQNADNYHHSLCQLFDEDAPEICTCGAPALFRQLAVLLGPGDGMVLETLTVVAQAA